MKVSIIIPIYNNIESFSCVMESIKYLNYDKKEFEVIVVDDCSQEKLEKIAKPYNDFYNVTYIRNEKNSGRSYSRNFGAEQAKGEILFFNDGDRILTPEILNEHMKVHNENENCVCIGNSIDVYSKMSKENCTDYVRSLLLDEKFSERKRMFYYYYQQLVVKIYNENTGKCNSDFAWLALMSGNVSLSKANFVLSGGFDLSFTKWGIENMEFGYRLMKMNMEYVFNKKAENIHIFHTENRNVDNLLQSIAYFYKKSGDDVNIMNYYKFLCGEISLGELTKRDDLQKEFYNAERIGSRYV